MPSTQVALPGNPTDYLPKSAPSQSTDYFSNHRISDSMSSVSSSTFLQRLKYFEQKTNEIQEERRKSQSKIVESYPANSENTTKLSIKTTINNARRQFPNETEFPSKKVSSNGHTSSNSSKEATPSSSRRSSANSNHSRKESLKAVSEEENILPIKCNNLSASDSIVSPENNIKSRSSKPVRELSIRSTINEARERFSRVNDYPELHKEKNNLVTDVVNEGTTNYLEELTESHIEKAVVKVGHLENQNSNCDQFFSTGSSTVLANEAFSKQFKVILRGYLYQNVFISLQHFGDETFYELEDYFDLGLSVSELFKVYNTNN